MPRISLSLLGPYQVSVDGKPVNGFATDKVRALLAYLALSPGRPHRREALAGLLWPEFPERSARASLRNALANLRNVLGEHASSGDPNTSPPSPTQHPPDDPVQRPERLLAGCGRLRGPSRDGSPSS